MNEIIIFGLLIIAFFLTILLFLMLLLFGFVWYAKVSKDDIRKCFREVIEEDWLLKKFIKEKKGK